MYPKFQNPMPPERRQRHAARVETVGRGAPVGTGVALRPPFTPRKIAAKSSSDRAAAPPAERCTRHDSKLVRRLFPYTNRLPRAIATSHDQYTDYGCRQSELIR